MSSVTIKTPAEQEGMRVAGRLAGEVLTFITPRVRAGITTAELDRLCHDYIVDVQKAVPAPLNYKGFPKSICTSVNHVVCHGIPGDKRLRQGDIVNVDVTVILDGWHGDTSRMYEVGEVKLRARRLIDVTYEAMMRGIRAARPGRERSDRDRGFNLVEILIAIAIVAMVSADQNPLVATEPSPPSTTFTC